MRLKVKRKLEHRAIEFLMTNNTNTLGKFIPLPYGLYWNSPNYFVNGLRQTNPQGYRSASQEVYSKTNKKFFRILILGSSTSYSDHYSLNPETSWCSHLQKYLTLQANTKIEVINGGLNYATSAELLVHFVFHFRTVAPDLVIMDGPGNDFLPLAHGDSSIDYRFTRLSARILRRRGETTILKSYFVRLFYLFWISTKNMIEMEPSNFSLENSTAIDNLLKSNLDAISNNFRTLTSLCNAEEISLCFVDFLRPSLQKMKELYPNSYSALLNFDKRVSLMCAELSKKTSIHIESNNFLFPDSAFHDGCHLTNDFEKLKAETIGNFLLNHPQIVSRFCKI